ncbi:MAG: MmcQ/YjbR family DNA-binding protein [Armatimonadota bacterium]|nr:MmcQ/YjbR family DNA-binding protein [Armatimonadota bacterium]
MPTQADVCSIVMALPEVTEDDGSFGFRVAGKPFVWAYLERVEAKKGRIPTTDRIGVRTLNEAIKFALVDETRRLTSPKRITTVILPFAFD